MKIDLGFTGTRKGMTEHQKIAVVYLLSQLQHKVEKYHHGDCKGADTEFHDILVRSGFYDQIETHPCNIIKQRAYSDAPKIHKPRDPLVRNRDIVLQSEILLATPGEEKEVLRSGTWATIREAGRQKKKVIIVFPSGKYNKT